MGVIHHHAIIVTADKSDIRRIHNDVNRLSNPTDEEWDEFDAAGLTVSVCEPGQANAYWSFMVLPDGSKHGWAQSNLGDQIRERIIEYLKEQDVDWAEVSYGELPPTVHTGREHEDDYYP